MNTNSPSQKNVAVSLFARSKLSQNKSSSDRVNTWKANTNIKNKAHISDLVIIVKIHFTGTWTSSAWNLVHKLTNSGMDVLITGNRLCFIEHCKKPGFLFIIIMWILNLQCANKCIHLLENDKLRNCHNKVKGCFENTSADDSAR